MKGYIRCIATFFGNYTSYQMDSKTIMNMMQLLGEYEVLPSVLDELQIEIKNNIPSQTPIKRYQFISLKDKLRISIAPTNIIIESDIKVNENNISKTDIDVFCSKVKNIYSILYKFIGIKANRISLLTTYLSDDIGINFSDKADPDDYFKGKNVFEWNVRSAIRENVTISKNSEIINVVSNISKTKGFIGSSIPFPNNLEFEGILFDIDINTIPENLNVRIDDTFANEFYDNALLLEHKIFKGRGLYGE